MVAAKIAEADVAEAVSGQGVPTPTSAAFPTRVGGQPKSAKTRGKAEGGGAGGAAAAKVPQAGGRDGGGAGGVAIAKAPEAGGEGLSPEEEAEVKELLKDAGWKPGPINKFLPKFVEAGCSAEHIKATKTVAELMNLVHLPEAPATKLFKSTHELSGEEKEELERKQAEASERSRERNRGKEYANFRTDKGFKGFMKELFEAIEWRTEKGETRPKAADRKFESKDGTMKAAAATRRVALTALSTSELHAAAVAAGLGVSAEAKSAVLAELC
eukprot:SAG11_NODE_8475_length_1011_cov_0.984649_1_plen_270_part_10